MPNPSIPPRPAAGAVIDTTWGQAIHDSQFGSAGSSYPYLDSLGGWNLTDIAAGIADQTFVLRYGHPVQPIAGLLGVVLGLWWRSSAVVTAGAFRLLIRVGTTWQPEMAVVNAAAGTTGTVRLATPAPFNLTTALQMGYGSDAGLLPAGSIDVACGLIVAYDYRVNP